MEKKVSLKKTHIKEGILTAELNQFFQKTYQDGGYDGIMVLNPGYKSLSIKTGMPKKMVTDFNYPTELRRLRALLISRFGFDEEKFSLYYDNIRKIESSNTQADIIRSKIYMGVPLRVIANSLLTYLLYQGAKGVDIVFSGKLRGQRAKTLKFRDGYGIHSGQPKNDFVIEAIRHAKLKQGILGIKVRIMQPYKNLPTRKKYPPDSIYIHEPKTT